MRQNHGERPPDLFLRVPPVVVHKPLDVLQEEAARTLVAEDALHLEEKRPARVLKAEPPARRRERLAREAAEKEVEFGDLAGPDLRDVAANLFVRVVLPQDLDRARLYLRREHAFRGNAKIRARKLESPADSADSREQVYEFYQF